MRTPLPPLVPLVLALACGGPAKKDTAAASQPASAPAIPAELRPPDPPAETVETFRARVWVDQDARQAPDWKKRLDLWIENSNAFIGPAFGMKLEVDVKEWQRKGSATDLLPLLQELFDTDPAGDVDWVIGVTAPAKTNETAHHLLGLSAVPGKHVLLRAIIDPAADEDSLSHKEVVVFVHELAHSIGALHEGDATSIMSLAYGKSVTTMPPVATQLGRLGVRIRKAETSGDGAAAAKLWGDLAGVLEKATTLEERERTQLLERARKLAAGTTGGAGMSAEDKKTYERAQASAKSIKGADRVAAAKAVDALLAKYPQDTSLRSASGAIYANAGALTKAEAHLQDAAAKKRVLASRRFYGLPPDAARYQITPELEPEYVAIFEEAHGALQKDQLKELADRANAGLKRFPGAPGLLALACGAELKVGKKDKAKDHCAKALAAWDETVLAHLFAGQLDPGPAGAEHLKRVVELDPTLEPQVKPLLEKRKKKGK